jgi:hypothetical protein
MVGIVEQGPRGFLLRTGECERWRLVYDDDIDHLVGQPVQVEGTRNGAAITAYFVGPVQEPEG